MEKITGNRSQVILTLIVIVMIAALASIYFWEPETENGFIPSTKGTIGVIEIYGVLDDTNYAYLLSQAVQEAINDDDVKAIVLEIDSPGAAPEGPRISRSRCTLT